MESEVRGQKSVDPSGGQRLTIYWQSPCDYEETTCLCRSYSIKYRKLSKLSKSVGRTRHGSESFSELDSAAWPKTSRPRQRFPSRISPISSVRPSLLTRETLSAASWPARLSWPWKDASMPTKAILSSSSHFPCAS